MNRATPHISCPWGPANRAMAMLNAKSSALVAFFLVLALLVGQQLGAGFLASSKPLTLVAGLVGGSATLLAVVGLGNLKQAFGDSKSAVGLLESAWVVEREREAVGDGFRQLATSSLSSCGSGRAPCARGAGVGTHPPGLRNNKVGPRG